MLEKLREKIANLVSPETTERIIETIDLLQIKLEDAEYTKLNNIIMDNDLSAGSLIEVRKTSYMYWLKYPMVKQAVRLLTEFVFADGVGKPKAKDEQVQDAVDEIWNHPNNQKELFGIQAQIEKSDQLQVDGEIFFVLFEDTDTKMLEISSLNPNEIVDVITDKDNKNKVLYYKRDFITREYDYATNNYKEGSVPQTLYYKDWENENETVPTGLTEAKIGKGVIYHVKVNYIRSKRGMPETYVYQSWAKSQKKMAEDLATYTKAMSTFAWKKKLKFGGKASVEALKNTYQAKRDRTNPTPATAATLIENEYIENSPFDFKTGATDWEKNIRQMGLQIFAGSGFGEQYFCNPATGNLAIGDKMELQVIKKVAGRQKLWADVYLKILMYGIKDRTILNEAEDGETQEVDYTIDIDFPPITTSNTLAQMQAIQIAMQERIITKNEAAVLGLTLLGVNNINEVIEALKDEPEPVQPPNPFMQQQPQMSKEAMMEILSKLEKRLKEAVNAE